jgi:hypothetical protein
MSNTIHLQGIGRVPAKPASELKVGDILSWNCSPNGYVVVSVRDVSPKFIEIVEKNRSTEEEFTRRLKKDRLVAAVSAGSFLKTAWEVWTYDVLGNSRDGFEVNDRYNQSRDHEIEAPIKVYNVGSPQEFKTAHVTGRQIRAAFGIKKGVGIETDGDDVNIYVKAAKNGYPIGELICVSHKSLTIQPETASV